VGVSGGEEEQAGDGAAGISEAADA